MANENKTPDYSSDISSNYNCTMPPGKHILGKDYKRTVINTATMTKAQVEAFMQAFPNQKIFEAKGTKPKSGDGSLK